jgi:cysteine synthase
MLSLQHHDCPEAPPVGARANVLDLVGNTPLVELRRLSPPHARLYAKLEGVNPSGSVKDRAAKYMIEAAERRGDLTPGMRILEPTSGNTGIALAMIARVKGYALTVVVPENVTQERIDILRLYGAEIVFSPAERGTNGAIAVAHEMAASGEYYMPDQYANPANPQAHYETTACEIIRDLPEVDAFVAGLGTGGTLMGVSRRLKEYDPKIQIVAAEPLPGDLVQGLRSLEEGFIPPIFDPSRLDGKFLVDSVESAKMTQRLVQEEGIFAGISSGAALVAAERYARQHPGINIVVLLADGGWKYLSAGVYDTTVDQERLEQSVLW